MSMAELVEGQRLREGYGPDEFTATAVQGVLDEREALAKQNQPPAQ